MRYDDKVDVATQAIVTKQYVDPVCIHIKPRRAGQLFPKDPPIGSRIWDDELQCSFDFKDGYWMQVPSALGMNCKPFPVATVAGSVQKRSMSKMEAAVVREIVKALEDCGAEEELIGIVRSWGEDLDDAEVLDLLRDWNEEHL